MSQNSALSFDEARAAIAALLPAPLLATETLPLAAALGRVLAAEITAPLDVPAADNAAMDGYALAGAALRPGQPSRLRQTGITLAGQAPAGPLAAGECRRIMTGAPLPAGADTVVQQELVTLDGDQVEIPADALRPGANCRRAGEELAAGACALPAGRRLGPAELATLATLGLAEVAVRRPLRVALLSTGDELCPPGRPLPPGGVYDSNRVLLAALLRQQNLPVELLDRGPVRDDPAALRTAFAQAAAEADVVLSTGGVSVGDADHTKRVMAELGEVLFWQLALRPGRPLAIGRIGDAMLFGLPGNPAAVLAVFEGLLREALLRLAGAGAPQPARLRARAAVALRKRPGRTELLRATLRRDPASGDWWAEPAPPGASVLAGPRAPAQALLLLPHEGRDVAAGDWVEVQPLPGWLG